MPFNNQAQQSQSPASDRAQGRWQQPRASHYLNVRAVDNNDRPVSVGKGIGLSDEKVVDQALIAFFAEHVDADGNLDAEAIGRLRFTFRSAEPEAPSFG